MARPSKLLSDNAHRSNEYINSRKKLEEQLRGNDNKLNPPEYLTYPQKKVFKRVCRDLGGRVGNTDLFVITMYAISIDRLNQIEKLMNGPERAADRKLMRARTIYTNEFFRCRSELCIPKSENPEQEAPAKVNSIYDVFEDD